MGEMYGNQAEVPEEPMSYEVEPDDSEQQRMVYETHPENEAQNLPYEHPENETQNLPYETHPENEAQNLPYETHPENETQNLPYETHPENEAQNLPYEAHPENETQNLPYETHPENDTQNQPYETHPENEAQSLPYETDPTSDQTEDFESEPQPSQADNSYQEMELEEGVPTSEGELFKKSQIYCFTSYDFGRPFPENARCPSAASVQAVSASEPALGLGSNPGQVIRPFLV